MARWFAVGLDGEDSAEETEPGAGAIRISCAATAEEGRGEGLPLTAGDADGRGGEAWVVSPRALGVAGGRMVPLVEVDEIRCTGASTDDELRRMGV